VDLSRPVLLALLDLLEADPELRQRARRVLLGVDAAGSGQAYVSRAQARAMGVEVKALQRAERSGEIVGFRVGRSTVYRVEDVRKLVEAHPVAAAVAPAAPVANDRSEPADPWERAVSRATRRRATAG